MGDSTEEKVPLTEAAQPEPEGTDNPPVPQEETPKDEGGAPEVPDYAALYEAEKKRLGQAEHTIEDLRRKNRDLKGSGEEGKPSIDPDELKRMVADEARSFLQTERQQESEDIILEELESLSGNEDERKLILLKYQTRVQKTGFTRKAIRDDLQEARDLANAPRYRKMAGEMAEAMRAKNSVGKTSYGGGSEKEVPKEDLSKHFTPEEWKLMKQNNVSEDGIRKALAAKRARSV